MEAARSQSTRMESTPVSYTHLHAMSLHRIYSKQNLQVRVLSMNRSNILIQEDVYKRQIHLSPSTVSNWMMAAAQRLEPIYNEPVSYTHLDVYKRQMEARFR